MRSVLITFTLFVALSASADDRIVSKIGFGSCLDQSRPMPIIGEILRHSPDLFLLIGDNVYPRRDYSVSALRDAYRDLDNRPEFRDFRSRIPLLVSWDDHDFGGNDAHDSLSMAEESKQLLLDFAKASPSDLRRSRRGIFDAHLYGPADKRLQIIQLDARTFRSPFSVSRWGFLFGSWYVEERDPNRTMLGDEQWRWLEGELRNPAKVRLIVSGTQFVAPVNGLETWSNLPAEKERLFRMIERTGAGGVIFLTGDLHSGELSVESRGPPYPLYDLTSSSLNVPRNKGPGENLRRIGSRIGVENFGEVTIDWSQPDPLITLALVGKLGEILLREEIPLSRITKGTHG